MTVIARPEDVVPTVPIDRVNLVGRGRLPSDFAPFAPFSPVVVLPIDITVIGYTVNVHDVVVDVGIGRRFEGVVAGDVGPIAAFAREVVLSILTVVGDVALVAIGDRRRIVGILGRLRFPTTPCRPIFAVEGGVISVAVLAGCVLVERVVDGDVVRTSEELAFIDLLAFAVTAVERQCSTDRRSNQDGGNARDCYCSQFPVVAILDSLAHRFLLIDLRLPQAAGTEQKAADARQNNSLDHVYAFRIDCTCILTRVKSAGIASFADLTGR